MKTQLLLALSLALAAQPALADSTASVNTSSASSSSSVLDTIQKYGKASYVFEMYGPTAKALSGNTDGTGTAITINHYFGVGAKIGGKWSVGMTQPFRQNIDDVEQGAPGAKDAFHALDPYVSLNNSRILGNSANTFRLASQLRYYAPLSKSTINARNDGKSSEAGAGTMRAVLIPSLDLMDGALSLSSATYFYYRFASKTGAEHAANTGGDASRNDFYVIAVPTVAYQATKNVQAYLETGMALRHRTHGKGWTDTDDKSDGLYIAPGAYISVGKKLTLNPYAQIGPFEFDVTKAQFVLAATYVFL